MPSQPTLQLDAATLAAVRAVPMAKTESQMISEVGYHEPSRTLRVKFTNNRIYLYSSVTKKMFDEFMASQSKGVWFGANIRAHAYLYPWMPEPQEGE